MSALSDATLPGEGYVEDPVHIDNPILAFFLNYWRERCAGGLPSRSDIHIRDFPQYLPWVMLLDAEDNHSEFRFRVIGTRVSQYFLGNAAGTTLTDAYQSAGVGVRELTRLLLQRVCTLGKPVRTTGPASTWEGHFFPNWDALFLPLGANHAVADSLLVAFTFNYEQFKKSRDPGSLMRFG